MNKLLTSGFLRPGLMNSKECRKYVAKNILRGKYVKKNRDGTPIEYNESITFVPQEFENQGILN
jgi:hypothetical protein